MLTVRVDSPAAGVYLVRVSTSDNTADVVIVRVDVDSPWRAVADILVNDTGSAGIIGIALAYLSDVAEKRARTSSALGS
ncbi:hypothetical protein [Actinokineospora enzanensis]|uniref:hypothetical protein n=1 Tax=Actinokineospora enzanensis TaxID=155975 RepID=UPI000378D5D8|nr:hypothetical protein [Actinokineospora enzanensis]